MKIALCATEKEEDPSLGFLSLASYLHLLQKKVTPDLAFFPLGRFDAEGWSEAFPKLRHLARSSLIPFGVGHRNEKKEDVYSFFFSDRLIDALPGQTISVPFQGGKFFLSLNGESPKEEGPLIRLEKSAISLERPPFDIASSREVYFLGISGPKFYQASVYRNGKIKCRLPEDHPNLLVKSLPWPGIGEQGKSLP